MGILLWIVFGAVLGSIARLLVPGPDPAGVMGRILIGILGGLVGGGVGMLSANVEPVGIDIRSLIMAVTGSGIALFGYRTFAMRAMA